MIIQSQSLVPVSTRLTVVVQKSVGIQWHWRMPYVGLERGVEMHPMRGNAATSHLFIVNPLRGGIAGLFSTHPPMDERVRRLEELAGYRR